MKVINIKPTTSVENVKPEGLAESVKPSALVEDIKPEILALNIKPQMAGIFDETEIYYEPLSTLTAGQSMGLLLGLTNPATVTVTPVRR